MIFQRFKIVLVFVLTLGSIMAYAEEVASTPITNTTNPSPNAPASSTEPAASSAPTSPIEPATPKVPASKVDTETNKQAESFEAICLNSWMKRFSEVQDKLSYKNFGEKYCACALTQPLDTDAAVDKAIQICMSRTLLRDSMDGLENEVGLDKATDKEVNQYCLDKWKLIYPQMSQQAQQNTSAFCSCAKPKLIDLIRTSDGMTDKEYYAQIDNIAASCSTMVKPSQAPTSTNPGTTNNTTPQN